MLEFILAGHLKTSTINYSQDCREMLRDKQKVIHPIAVWINVILLLKLLKN